MDGGTPSSTVNDIHVIKLVMVVVTGDGAYGEWWWDGRHCQQCVCDQVSGGSNHWWKLQVVVVTNVVVII